MIPKTTTKAVRRSGTEVGEALSLGERIAQLGKAEAQRGAKHRYRTERDDKRCPRFGWTGKDGLETNSSKRNRRSDQGRSQRVNFALHRPTLSPTATISIGGHNG